MAEIFHVYASHGRNNYVELDLPASGYEMLDMMERLRLEPGQLPYVEVLKFREDFDYLERCLHEQRGLLCRRRGCHDRLPARKIPGGKRLY